MMEALQRCKLWFLERMLCRIGGHDWFRFRRTDARGLIWTPAQRTAFEARLKVLLGELSRAIGEL